MGGYLQTTPWIQERLSNSDWHALRNAIPSGYRLSLYADHAGGPYWGVWYHLEDGMAIQVAKMGFRHLSELMRWALAGVQAEDEDDG